MFNDCKDTKNFGIYATMHTDIIYKICSRMCKMLIFSSLWRENNSLVAFLRIVESRTIPQECIETYVVQHIFSLLEISQNCCILQPVLRDLLHKTNITKNTNLII